MNSGVEALRWWVNNNLRTDSAEARGLRAALEVVEVAHDIDTSGLHSAWHQMEKALERFNEVTDA